MHFVGHFVYGAAQFICRGFVELAYANVPVSRLQDFVSYARNFYLLPRQVKRQRIIIIFAAYPDRHRCARTATHLPDRLVQSLVTHRHAVNLDDLVAGFYPRALCGSAIDRCDNEDRTVQRADFEAYSRVSAAGAVTNVPVFLCVEEFGVPVESRHHAANGAVHEIGLIDRFDEVPAHTIHDFINESCLFPGQMLFPRLVPPRQHAAAERQAQSQDRADDEYQDAPGFQ